MTSSASPHPPAAVHRGPIAWMANNAVAANLLMLVAVVGGVLTALSIKQEVFPEFELDAVTIGMAYPGASPSEVEQGIVLAIEEAVRGIDGVKRVTSVASEGAGNVTVELLLGAKSDEVVADVKSAVDRIVTFPEEAEAPNVAVASRKRAVISLIFSGPHEDSALHEMAERARSGLLSLDGITQVEVSGVRPLEISIEIAREDLEAYGITLEQVAAEVRNASVELPGGSLDTQAGQLLVRVTDRRRRGSDFADIVLRGAGAGHDLRLGDIATIVDGYEDTDKSAYFDGQPAVTVTAYRVGKETPIGVSELAREYAESIRADLPQGVKVTVWNDDSELLASRIDLLVRNAKTGLILVLVTLALFLQRRLAAWVAVGIPVAFLGAFVLMGAMGVSINMISLFAMIVTLGMVVDDAIIVAENVHGKRLQGLSPLDAAIQGAREMAVPVVFSILTTVAAFAPLLFVPGVMGKIMGIIPVVVIAVLLLSLVESFWVLPAHLAHGGGRKSAWSKLFRPLDRVQAWVSGGLDRFIQHRYRPFLGWLLSWRYTVVAMGVASLACCAALVASGVIPFQFFPRLEGDSVTAQVRLPYGTPVARTREVASTIERASREVAAERGGQRVLRGVLMSVGSGAGGRGLNAAAGEQGSHLANVQVSLVTSEERDFSANEFAAAWREALPPLPGVETLTIASRGGPGAGNAVDVQLSHRDSNVLAEASTQLQKELESYPSLTDVDNTYAGGKAQLDFRLRREASGLGLKSRDVARALRSSFFGAEALREQRGRNELKVRVRLPEHQRSSEHDLDQLLVGTPAGASVPLSHVAEVTRGRAPTSITREGGLRSVNVSADLAVGAPSARPVLESLTETVLPKLESRFPGLSTRMVGQKRERDESFASLGPNFLFALFVIFALLAIPFKSYLQPIVVMSAIPFGILGAVIGHAVMGYSLSFISVLGIIALSGVVVNDSLVLVDGINRYRAQGSSVVDSVVQGGMRRFRPILLTSLTTFFGLMPMIFETSRQAKFLIPMAISLGFGALFVTLIALLLVPSLYLIVEDLRKLPDWVFGSRGVEPAE